MSCDICGKDFYETARILGASEQELMHFHLKIHLAEAQETLLAAAKNSLKWGGTVEDDLQAAVDAVVSCKVALHNNAHGR